MISFSIIIPTHGRPASALSCLASLLRLDYPRELLEVVLVEDGAGPDPLRDEDLAPFVEPLNLRVIRQENAGPGAARNRGAAEATGAYLAFTDDDCEPDPAWLRRLGERLEEKPDAVLGGHSENAIGDNPRSETSQVLLDYIYEYLLAKGTPFFASNNIALSRESFELVGGFDRSFAGAGGEDRDFCARCLEHGLEFEYVPEAVIDHLHDLSLRRFFRQHFNYGRGAYVYHQARVERGHETGRLEPLRFYLDMVRYPHSLPRERRPSMGAALIVLSQVANAVGYFTEKLAPVSRTAEGAQDPTQSKADAAQARIVAREAGGTWSASVLGIGCRYLAMLGATHVLGDRLFGDYTLSLAITGIFAVVAALGLSPGVLPFLSRARRSGKPEEIRSIVRSALLPVTIVSLLLTAGLWGASSWAGEVIFDKPDLHRFLGPMSGLVALGAISMTVLALLQGFMAVKERAWIERVVVAGTIAVGMALSWVWDLEITGAVTATLGGAAAGLIAALLMLTRRAPSALSFTRSAVPLRVRSLLGFSWPLMGTSMLAFLLLWTDVLLMGVYRDSNEVGVYGACARIAAIALLAHESLGPVFVARLSDLFTAKDWPGIHHLFRLTARWAMWPGLALAWAFALWSGDVLSLFGAEFRAGATVLGVLCLGKAVASSTGMTGRVLGITGRARLNLLNMILLVGGNVLLNILWIPRFGGMGAAVATTLSLVLVRALQVTEISLLYGIHPWSRKSLIPLFGTSALAALVYPVRAGLPGSWGWLVPMGAFLVACGALFAFTSIGEDDRAVWRALRERLRAIR